MENQAKNGGSRHINEGIGREVDEFMEKIPKWVIVLVLAILGLVLTYLVYLNGNWVAQPWW